VRVAIAKSVTKRATLHSARQIVSQYQPDRGAGLFPGVVKPRIGAKVRCVAGHGRKKWQTAVAVGQVVSSDHTKYLVR